MSTSEYKRQTISGLKWNILNQVVYQGFSLLINVVLMRIIAPEDFGLLGMVLVFTGFLIVFRDFNLGNSLIQKQNIDKTDENTVFWTSIFIGLLLTIILALSGPLIAAFYNKSVLAEIIYVLSITFFLQSLTTIQNALLFKKMDFKRIFWINFISVLFASFVALLSAYNGKGVWSLVYQQLTFSCSSLLLFWVISPWRPDFNFSFLRLKTHLKFGLPMVGSQAMNYWTRNADNLLIGKYLGSVSLGLYSRAYSIMMLPVGQISGIIAGVMFPSFSKIQDDKDRVKHIYLRISRTIAFVTFPLMGILLITAEPFVKIILGSNWINIIPTLQILAVVGALQSIGTLVGNIFMSQGKTKSYFYVNLFSSIIIISSFVIGVFYSIEIIAVSYLCATLTVMLPQWFIAGKFISCSLFEMLKNIASHVIISILLVSSFLIFQEIFYLKEVIRLFLIPVLYSVLWLMLIKVFNVKLFNEIKELIKELF